jgi:hypothetical protein
MSSSPTVDVTEAFVNESFLDFSLLRAAIDDRVGRYSAFLNGWRRI